MYKPQITEPSQNLSFSRYCLHLVISSGKERELFATQNSSSQARLPKFEPELGHPIVPHHWANFLTKLYVNFLSVQGGGGHSTYTIGL